MKTKARDEQEELGVHSCKVFAATCYYMTKDCDQLQTYIANPRAATKMISKRGINK